MLYHLFFRLIFTRFNPETAHHLGIFALKAMKVSGVSRVLRSSGAKVSPIEAFGLTFEGPFGMAAGFDKNAVVVEALGDLGFSHVEIGTVTALAQPGNPKPRLFRLIPDRALINRMGFNNDGAEVVAERLGRLRARGARVPIIGVNIGKSRAVEVEDAVDDYRTSARLLAPFADYVAVNVSSPNTPGLRSLQSVEALRPILVAVLEEARGVPVLVKIAPDLANEDIDAVADLALELGLAGVIATNTTISRENLKTEKSKVDAAGAGGLSGAPLKVRALEVLDILARRLAGRISVISVGGVETAAEVSERLAHGATLVQGYSAFVFEGPLWARKINRELAN